MTKKKKTVAVSKAKSAKTKAKGRPVASPSKTRSKSIKRRVAQPNLKTKPKLKSKPLAVAPSEVKIPKKYRSLYNALARLQERIARQINFLATDNLSRTQNDTEVNFRSEEQGTDNFDRDFALNRVSLNQDILFEIDEALNRIQMKTYGVCESCGHSIEHARLTALPYSRMCVTCQAQSEAGHKHKRSVESTPLFPNADKVTAETAGDDE